jgi:hypothetical protein
MDRSVGTPLRTSFAREGAAPAGRSFEYAQRLMEVAEKLAQIGAQSETQHVDLQGKKGDPARTRKPLRAVGSFVGSNPTPSAFVEAKIQG